MMPVRRYHTITLVVSSTAARSLQPFGTSLMMHLLLGVAIRQFVSHQATVRGLIEHGSARLACEDGVDLFDRAVRNQCSHGILWYLVSSRIG